MSTQLVLIILLSASAIGLLANIGRLILAFRKWRMASAKARQAEENLKNVQIELQKKIDALKSVRAQSEVRK